MVAGLGPPILVYPSLAGIAFAVGVSKTNVANIIKRADSASISWPVELHNS